MNFVPSEENLCVLNRKVWSVLLSQTLGIDVDMLSSYVNVCHVKNKLSGVLIFFLFSFFADLQQSNCRG